MTTNNSINNPGNSFLTPANNLSDVSTPATARLNLFIPVSVNTGTVLAATAYGKEVVCTGSASYALTLPTVTSNSNKFIDIFSQTTSNALVTITPASGTIAGQSTLIIGSGDGVRVMNDGTNWWLLNQWLQPVSFFATLSGAQTISNNTVTTVAFDGTTINVGSFFNTSTHTFTPLMPGAYQFDSAALFVTSATAAQPQRSSIFKNGSEYARRTQTLAANFIQVMINPTYTTMNGTTDNVLMKVFQVSTGNLNLEATATSSTTSLSGFRVSLF